MGAYHLEFFRKVTEKVLLSPPILANNGVYMTSDVS